jgi:hypothetical protein
MSARPPVKDRASARLLVKQNVFAAETELRRCVVCGAHVTNDNLGGYSGRSALGGDLWCLSCADGRPKP